MPPSNEPAQLDWILSSGSNVHIAQDFLWFKTYTKFDTHVHPTMGGGQIPVLGIGDVELKLEGYGDSGHLDLVLKDVLYAPSAICNQVCIGSLVEDPDIELQTNFRTGGTLARKTNNGIQSSRILKDRLMRLHLKGKSPEDSSLPKDREFSLSVEWPNEEIRKWEIIRRA